ncbi:hypothetical protein QEH56_13800 [Pelagicoccus enzymogenes]|uniref:hypothetical protein n=1 Tax=Pelagicoccus enzymogenes TaxID=2773457 RepID=UPI00281098F8|nr:hypothetical protein [Pelagicoccus enzymogenes]MDQ8199238.1 hypothetical protein [Pelagicoccus enzymogenes]
MSNKPKEKSRTLGDLFYGALSSIVPSCGPAMEMVERGQERPLKLGEKIVLLYNTPLCPHCNCNREKFRVEREKMRRIRSGS